MIAGIDGGFRSGGFAEKLAAENHLSTLGFDRFVFLPGMGFDVVKQWWSPTGQRPFSHEGVDLCLFQTHGKGLLRLDETIRVPLMHPGRIVAIIPDFLDRTVIVRHGRHGMAEEDFYTFYGHVTPNAQMAVGDALDEGEVFARIADVDLGRTRLPAHLHVSAAWCRRLPPVENLTWPLLNRTARSAFFDPLSMLAVPYEVITPSAAGPLHKIPKCGLVLKTINKGAS
jgi:hypothetical protein